jgi:hypothetical protein
MLNDTTKPGEVLHKGGFDLLTLLHRRDVELHAHLTLWCGNDDEQRCEHFDHGFITRPSSSISNMGSNAAFPFTADSCRAMPWKTPPRMRKRGGVPGPDT